MYLSFLFWDLGWSFPWALVAVGATQFMLNKLDYSVIWDSLTTHGITHYNAAPTVQNELCNHRKAVRLNHPVRVLSGGLCDFNKCVYIHLSTQYKRY